MASNDNKNTYATKFAAVIPTKTPENTNAADVTLSRSSSSQTTTQTRMNELQQNPPNTPTFNSIAKTSFETMPCD